MYVETTPEGYNIIGISTSSLEILRRALVLHYILNRSKDITVLLQQIDRELVNTEH